MNKQDSCKRNKKVYEPPQAVNLSGMAANGQQVDAKGICWVGTGPGYCNTGNSPVNQCSFGNGASAPQNCQQGSFAAFTCSTGTGVYAQSCLQGTRPYHCTVGSRA